MFFLETFTGLEIPLFEESREPSDDDDTVNIRKKSILNNQRENLSEVENRINLASNLGCKHWLKKVSFYF